MIFTSQQIKELAEFAGFQVNGSHDEDELETEYTILEYPDTQVRDDDGCITYHDKIAYLTDYPEEGCYPLGEEVNAPKNDDNCSKCGKPWDTHEFGIPEPYCP